MATGGRPPERPVHLSSDERLAAQRRTAQWRGETGMSQTEIARELSVSAATYRGWENGKDPHAGPTRPLAAQLDVLLQRVLRGRYASGDALRVWGWAASGDITYERLADMLRLAGFDVPNSHAERPSVVVWVHRLHDPNLVHAVFTLAAAAATRAGLTVRLLLDDTALSAWERPRMRNDLETRIRSWFRFAAGHEDKLSTGLYSEILTAEMLAERGWRTVCQYLTPKTEMLKFLLAAKIISPTQYSTESEASVLAILRQSESLHADSVLTALQNWIVFEHEIQSTLESLSRDDPMPVVTLGGEDERHLWELWHSCCADELTSRVQHIYLNPMPMPSYRAVWREPALAARASRPTLADYLRGRMLNERNSDAAEWIINAAISLPAFLNEDFLAWLDPLTLDIAALLQRSAEEIAAAIAKAVVEWVNK
jgi:transcriptional regulator with XRE-family HTH domain